MYRMVLFFSYFNAVLFILLSRADIVCVYVNQVVLKNNMTSDSSSTESDTDVRSEGEPSRKRKRGVRNKYLYKHEVQKRHRLRGEAYTSTTTGRIVSGKSNTEDDCTCKNKCTQIFTVEEKEGALRSLYSGRPKNEQDTFLMGLIKRSSVARRRSKNENPKKRDNTYTYYFLNNNSERIEVCRQAFSILYAVKNKAIFRLTSLIAQGKPPIDCRGLHSNRGNALPTEAILAVDEHIRSFPLKQSHYSSKQINYLNSDLNVKIMHELFLKKHPDQANTIKYDFYRKYFNDNHGYRFGRPQVDVCSTCEELEAKIKSTTLNDNAKRVAAAEKIVHLRRAKKFYQKQKDVLTNAGTGMMSGLLCSTTCKTSRSRKYQCKKCFI